MDNPALIFEIYSGDQVVRTERLDSNIIKIGNLPTSHLMLDSPDVSGVHAVIEVSEDTVQLIDLGSARGTKVNGSRVTKSELLDGDTLEFGGVRVGFQIEGAQVEEAVLLEEESAVAAGAVVATQKFKYVRMLERPNDTKHYSRRFLSQPSRADGTIEVAVVWRDHVMAELTVHKNDRGLRIGSDRRNDVVINDPTIPAPQHVLVSRRSDGSAYLHLSPRMEGEVYIEAERYSIADAIRMDSGDGIRLSQKTRARIFFGDTTVYVHQGTRPQVLLPLGAIDGHVLYHFGISAVLHSILLILIFLVPPDATDLDVDSFMLEDEFVSIEALEEEPEPDELPEILQEDEEEAEDEELAELERGDEGEAGLENEEEEDRRMAIEGEEDNEIVELSRAELEEQVRDRSALLVLQEMETGPSSPFGTTASGYDDVHAYGNLYGDSIGTARGFGGIGLTGGGNSGGGNNPRGFGVGPISTRGRFGGDTEDDDYGSEFDEMRERTERDVEVELGRASVEGHLDREIIQRVIREHRREITECYNSVYQQDQDIAGRVVVSFTISATGDVVRAEIGETELNNSEVEDCLTTRILRIHFPEPSSAGLVHVNYPFVFVGG